jgi:hypothetical protein
MRDDFVLFVVVGFAAQLVDGAVGMAYGVSATTVLLSLGVAPATASARARSHRSESKGDSQAPRILIHAERWDGGQHG